MYKGTNILQSATQLYSEKQTTLKTARTLPNLLLT